MAVAAGLLMATSSVPARAVTTVPLGTASGVVGIYYNSTGGEVPSNQAYIRAQFSPTNTNGSQFNFDTSPLPGTGGTVYFYNPGSPSSSLFQVVPNQFGLDLIVKAPTSNNSVMPPPLTAYDNVGRRAVPPPDAHQARLRPDDHPARRAQRLRDGLLQDHL